MRGVLRACVSFVCLILLTAVAFAQAEVRVFVGGAMTQPVKDAGAAFARSSGATLVYVSDTTGALQKRLAAGEKADVVVVTGPAMDMLQKENRVVAGSRVDLARALIGVGVRAGAASPDLSTPDSFKAALLKARSVSYVNPAAGGTSGAYFEGLLQRMGIADAMKTKIVYRTQGSDVADAVAKGEAELGITFTSELQPNKGVKVVGTLPAAIQLPTIYSAAIATTAASGDAARAFLRTLAGAEGRAALTKAGLEPLVVAARGAAESAASPTNGAPNPYRTVENWAKLPEGRMWGSLSAVDIDKDGKSIWVAERCGGNSACLDSPTVDPILKFDSSGKLLKSFGAGMLVSPHGIYVDRDGNIWVTDYQDNAPRPTRGAAPAAVQPAPPAAGPPAPVAARGPAGPAAGSTKGHQVFKFSPDGKLLLTLGKPGGGVGLNYFFQPNDVIVAPTGEIFVAQGHGQGQSEVLKFSKDGAFMKRWGKTGTGPGEFDQPHALAFESRGRLFVGDRNNNRIQIFDRDGHFIEQWIQFSRPSGIFIDKRDNIYVADSESGSVARNHPGWKRGIRIGNVKDGKVIAFIPDPDENATGTSAAEGVAADAQGNIYGAEVGPRTLKKYAKK